MYRILTLLCIVVFFSSLKAQKLYIGIQAGIATGTPAGKIPEGATGALGVGPTAGILIGYEINDKIGLQVAPAYAQKSARYNSPIEGKTKISEEIFGIPFTLPFNLSYEGIADGEYDNRYIDIPLQITYQLGRRTQVYVGGQASRLLTASHVGEVDVKVAGFINRKDEPFDQSEFIQEWDFAAMLGTNIALTQRLYAQADVAVGLGSIFTDDFDELEGAYRNVYLKIQLNYRLFEKSWKKGISDTKD